jgi:hypothetical protein
MSLESAPKIANCSKATVFLPLGTAPVATRMILSGTK